MKENRCDDLERDQAAHQAKIDEARESIRRLMRRLGDTDDPEVIQPLEERLAELRGVISAHQAEARQIESKLIVVKNQAEALRQWSEACLRGKKELAGGSVDFADKRDLLKALGVKVVAKKRDAELRFGVPLVTTDSSHGSAAGLVLPGLEIAAGLLDRLR
ncbi:glycoside hydrolase family 3 protein [Singulisphaera acidiphila]|uniref:Uncharacterized protein n=1 Tax=Singulisphaera acidiphila (strain ATCC BAA-1392 / DSM 18658 / VKM B-2454 / MOB10) TaxID=886293 RepID=L0DCB9_SINAD|nr:hypothetical protein [Singulisphaera acidiphila]AGA26515.1 hypothetical protein Sinac_2193 [Singulisphaera acidiphila DSM 18658]